VPRNGSPAASLSIYELAAHPAKVLAALADEQVKPAAALLQIRRDQRAIRSLETNPQELVTIEPYVAFKFFSTTDFVVLRLMQGATHVDLFCTQISAHNVDDGTIVVVE
jgi:hypothetical protein